MFGGWFFHFAHPKSESLFARGLKTDSSVKGRGMGEGRLGASSGRGPLPQRPGTRHLCPRPGDRRRFFFSFVRQGEPRVLGGFPILNEDGTLRFEVLDCLTCKQPVLLLDQSQGTLACEYLDCVDCVFLFTRQPKSHVHRLMENVNMCLFSNSGA